MSSALQANISEGGEKQNGKSLVLFLVDSMFLLRFLFRMPANGFWETGKKNAFISTSFFQYKIPYGP